MKITEEDIQAVKSYTSKYPKPHTPELHYPTANSVDIHKDQLPLSGSKNTGFVQEEGKITIDNDVWENAVAFETYIGREKLIKVVFRGAGSGDITNEPLSIPLIAGMTK